MKRKDEILTREQVRKRINDLLTNEAGEYAKHQRNYALYNQSPISDLNVRIPSPVGLFDDVYSEESTVPKLNIIKSAIDSVVSKISTAHCRPFVNTVNGSFKTIQICKQLQVFFDYFLDEKKVQSRVTEALLNACVFGRGYVLVDEDSGDVSNPHPWNVYTRQREKGDFKSAYIEFPHISVDLLKDGDYELLSESEIDSLYVTLGYFYDARTRTKAVTINREIRSIVQSAFSVVPLVPIFYTIPISGNSTLSIADMLRGIQEEIDALMQRISDAAMQSPALTFFLNNASNIKVGQLNNRVGNIVQYNSPATGGTTPVDVATPEFISNQYISLLNDLIEKAYNMVGISQLSAQGKKTPGLNSGVALATQADIESDRFQTLLDQYIQTFTDIAKVMLKIFQGNKTVVKPSRYALRLTWGDVEKEFDKMRIQFSCADSLSKDPSEKLKQLQTLAQAGIIPATQIASLLELPDINRGYSVANNSFNAVQTLIDSCVYEGKFEIPPYVSLPMLEEQIINMALSLRAAQGSTKSNEKDIERLVEYYSKCKDEEERLSQMQNAASIQNVAENNAYSKENNSDFGNGVEDELNMEREGTANPIQTDAANGGELGESA